jgi:serine/threonine protein kinase
MTSIQENSLASTIISSRTIANYRLIEMRGSGGMASVFKAIQLSLERPVALKIMHPHLNSNEVFIARFEKEAKRAAMLHHENIVSIIDYGCDSGEYYIAMEYIDGVNLSDMLKKQKKMPLEITLFICQQVAEGLKYAHNLGIVHRDIKPANIMLSYDGRVLITDFGIAKATSDPTITSTGQIVGSPSYMSPEQAAGKTTDDRSDLFSLGIILYEMLAGEKPFKGETYQSLVTSIMSDNPMLLQTARVDVTPEIDVIIQKALNKAADSRFKNAEELSDSIESEFAKFKITSPRKMMAEYLKNPIRVTERLRSDKISDHMESALFYLTVGEGKLAEAKREFQEVLRFDRNNRNARKYISRLEAFSSFHNQPMGFWKKKLGHGISLSLAFTTILVLVFAVAVLFSNKDSDINKPLAPPPSKVVIPESKQPSAVTSKSNVEPVKSPAIADKTQKSASSTKKETVNSEQNTVAPIPEPQTAPLEIQTASMTILNKPLADTTGSIYNYNYPDQKLERFGSLKIITSKPVKLEIDDIRYGWTNGPAIKLSPGRHLVEIEVSDRKKISKRIFLKNGEILSIEFPDS